MNYHISKRVYLRAGGVFCSLLCLGTSLDAWADAEDPLNFLVGVTYRQDDNLFRLAPNVAPLPVLGKDTKADKVRISYFGLRLDKTYSQQRFKLDTTLTNYRYQTYGRLNFDARDISGKWLWHLTQKLSGTLSADRQQTQSNFADTRNFASSGTRTTENRRFDADWWLAGSWHLVGGVAEYRQRNSQAFVAEDSYRYRSGETGVRYVSEALNSLTLLRRQGQGKYEDRTLNAPLLLDTGFDQDETEVRFNWQLTGKSNLTARVTDLDRKHQHFAARDFSGRAGKVDYTWTPSGQVQLALSAGRDISSWQTTGVTNYGNASYYVSDSLAFAPTWQLSAHTTLRGRYERIQRDYLGSTNPGLLARQDQMRTAMIGVDWAPTRAFSLSASVQRDTRDSNDATMLYRAKAATVTAQLFF